MQSTSSEMLGWKKHKLESRLLGEYQSPQICRWHHPYSRKWRGTKKPLDESERGEWKIWLKAPHSENEDHGIQSHHFMANRWGNSWNSSWLFFWAPKSLWMVIAAMKLKDACSLDAGLLLSAATPDLKRGVAPPSHKSTEVSVLASVLPMNTQQWSLLGWTGWISLQSKGLSRVFFNTTVQKHQLFSTQLSL